MKNDAKLIEIEKSLVSRVSADILIEFIKNYIASRDGKIELLELMTTMNLWLEDTLRLAGYMIEKKIAIVEGSAIALKEKTLVGKAFLKEYQWLIKWDTIYDPKNQPQLNLNKDEKVLLMNFNHQIQDRPSNNDKIDQYYNTTETNIKRLRLVTQEPLVEEKNICFFGDDDLTSLMFAMSKKFKSVTVFDIDSRIVEFINQKSRDLGLENQYSAKLYDYRTDNKEKSKFEIFHSDPPATVEAIDLVLKRTKEFARPSSSFYLSWPEFICDPDYLMGITEAYVKNGWLVTAKYPEFNEYNNECFFNYITSKDRTILKLFTLTDEKILNSPALQRYCLTRLQLASEPTKTVGEYKEEIYLSNLHKLPNHKFLKK